MAPSPAPAPVATTPEASEPTAPPTAPPLTTPASMQTKPHAEIGDWGFDRTGMDTSTAPGMDFYKFANGTWHTNTEIPNDKSDYGMFTKLDDLSKERTKQL